MSIIKVEDIAHVRFRAPDLARMEAFLRDFGLTPSASESTPERLYMRGRDAAPFLHVTEQGEPAFLAVGFRAASLDDLNRLAAASGAPVEPITAPGGGAMVRLRDPDGHGVEVVAGQTPGQPSEDEPPVAWNSSLNRARLGALKRVGSGSSSVVRLGHAVLNVADFRRSEAWYKHHFGFLTSDEIQITTEFSLGAFMRCDRGATPTDHHTLFLAQLPSGPGFNHAAFEVRDLDDLMRGHQHLRQSGAHAEWGVGRHILGSQVFDYWRDPWGFTLEHWTDGDLLTAEVPPHTAALQELMGVQWGMSPPATMGG
ncbi:MAG TPA: VOC family protein [Caulobacteraceae bacterium]|nr:VOC family protein [Caulobacteraceae bacterium]